MAERISVQIALEGGAEVARQLESIGEAGQRAFADIAKSAEEVGGFKKLDPAEVTAKLKAFGIEGTAAFEKIQQAVQKAVRFESFAQGIATAENALLALGRAAVPIGAGIVVAFNAAAKATIGFAAEIQKATIEATKLGLTVEQFDRMRSTVEGLGASSSAAGQAIRGFGQTVEQIKLDQVNQAFKQLQALESAGIGARGSQQLKTLQDAAAGTGKAAEVAAEKLRELGLAVPPNTIAEQFKNISNSIAGLNREAQFNAVIQALAQIKDPAQQAALAIKFFGDSGAEVARKLQTLGPAAITAKDAVAGLITPEAAAKADALDSAINRLQSSFNRLGSVSFAGPITIALDALATTLDKVNATASKTTFGGLVQGALLLNPFHAALQLIISALQNLSGSAQQAGQSMAQIGQAGAAAWQVVVSAVQDAGSAIGNFISSLTGITWDTVSGAGVAAWNAITGAIQGTISAIGNFASSMVSIAWDTISGVGVAAWNALTAAIQNAINKVLELIGLKPSAPAAAGGSVGGLARGGLLGGRGSGTSDSNLAWVSRGEYITPAHVVRKPGMLALLEALRRGGGIPGFAAGGKVDDAPSVPVSVIAPIFNRTIDILKGAVEALRQFQIGFNNSMANTVQSINQSLNALATPFNDAIDNIVQMVVRAADTLQGLNSEMNKATKQARGGLLGGRGTGTSDSNLAWLSRGEYITPARAVRQPGVLAFLEALRRSGGNLSAVLDGMGRFALGGLVPRPAFAGGGTVGSMSNVTINFPGTPPISGLRASAQVVDQLQKAAALAQVRSGGRKPSRYS